MGCYFVNEQQFVAKSRSVSEPESLKIASKVIQLMATKTSLEKWDFGKNSTKWVLWKLDMVNYPILPGLLHPSFIPP
jgi:hypothetical protein